MTPGDPPTALRDVPGAVPPGWEVLRTDGLGPFTTHALLRQADGREVEWTSRRNRKRLGLRAPGARRLGDLERRWGGRPSRASWAMGVLFALGSACFAVASLPPFFDTIAPGVVAGTFFVGSIFFTTASALQYREALAAPGGVGPDAPRRRGWRAIVGWKLRGIDWWAAAVQLVGTVFFNISTFAATRTDLDLTQERRLIWAPDVAGSICCLVASWLAWTEVNPGLRPRSDRSVGWRIAALNLVGSIAFGVAAVAARYLRTTGDPANITLVNLGTFLGAVCFLAGAVLLPVESAQDTSADPG